MTKNKWVWYDGNDNYQVLDDNHSVLSLNNEQIGELDIDGNAGNFDWFTKVEGYNLLQMIKRTNAKYK